MTAAAKLFALPVALLAGCTASPGTLDALNSDQTLTLQVGGTAARASDISFITDGFGTSQVTKVRLPWKKTITYKSGIVGVNMNAQNAGGGTITCKITDSGGKVLASNESSGEYAVVGCAVS